MNPLKLTAEMLSAAIGIFACFHDVIFSKEISQLFMIYRFRTDSSGTSRRSIGRSG